MKIFILLIVIVSSTIANLYSNWIPIDSLSNVALFLRVECYDTNNCVVLGDAIFLNGSEVRVTSDGGKSWKITLIDDKIIDYNGKKLYPSVPYDITYPGYSTCIMVCDSGNIWLSKDGAQTWKKSCLPTRNIISKITMYNENFGGLLSSKLLYLTFDGGVSWDSVQVKPDDISYAPLFLQNIQIVKDSVIILNAYRSDKKNYILRSSDLGKSWEGFPKDPFRMNDIFFQDKNIGWAIGDYTIQSKVGDNILNTIDGGKTWVKKLETVIENNTNSLSRILFSDKNNGIAFGERFYFWRTKDGGDTWKMDTSFSFYNNDEILSDIAMPTASIHYGVQYWGKKTFKYTDYSTGVEDINPNESILLYPNPISSGNKLFLKLNSDFSANYSLSLYNSLGQIIGSEYQSQISNTKNLEYDTSDLKSGIYFLYIKTKGKSIMKSFIVE